MHLTRLRAIKYAIEIGIGEEVEEGDDTRNGVKTVLVLVQIDDVYDVLYVMSLFQGTEPRVRGIENVAARPKYEPRQRL
jgi:hypothetical protein